MRIQLQAEVDRMKADLGGVVTDVNDKVSRVETGMHNLNEAGKRITEQLELQQAHATTQIQQVIADATSEFGRQREAIEKNYKEVENTKNEIGKMMGGIREELDLVRGQIQSLQAGSSVGATDAAAKLKSEWESMKMELIKIRTDLLSDGATVAQRTGSGEKYGGFIPWKQLTPKPFGAKEDHWREWAEEFRDYLDAMKPGMKTILITAEKEPDNIIVNTAWAKLQNDLLGAESTNLWRALKKLTEEGTEARQVVSSVPGEDGYAAWIKLHQRYSLAL